MVWIDKGAGLFHDDESCVLAIASKGDGEWGEDER
jgi:hypothetical protein